MNRILSFCSTSGIGRVTLVVNQMTSHRWIKESDCDYDKRSISVIVCVTDIL